MKRLTKRQREERKNIMYVVLTWLLVTLTAIVVLNLILNAPLGYKEMSCQSTKEIAGSTYCTIKINKGEEVKIYYK